jgi:hypothetical protein
MLLPGRANILPPAKMPFKTKVHQYLINEILLTQFG